MDIPGPRSVAAQVLGEQGAGLAGVSGAHEDRPRSVAEQDRGIAVARIQQGRGVRLGGDDQRVGVAPGADEGAGAGQGVRKPGAGGGQVHRRCAVQPEPVGDLGSGRRAPVVGRRGRQQDDVGCDGRSGQFGGGVQRGAARRAGQVAGAGAVVRVPAGGDAGTFADPAVVGVEAVVVDESLVGDDARRKARAQAAQDRGGGGHGNSLAAEIASGSLRVLFGSPRKSLGISPPKSARISAGTRGGRQGDGGNSGQTTVVAAQVSPPPKAVSSRRWPGRVRPAAAS